MSYWGVAMEPRGTLGRMMTDPHRGDAWVEMLVPRRARVGWLGREGGHP